MNNEFLKTEEDNLPYNTETKVRKKTLDQTKIAFSLRNENEDERIKTETDERQKTEERQLLNLEIEIKANEPPLENENAPSWKKFLSFSYIKTIFKQKLHPQENNNDNNTPISKIELDSSPKKSIMKSFNLKRKERPKINEPFENSQPTRERIKYLWGVARRKVFYAIKFVEGSFSFNYLYSMFFSVTNVRENRSRSILLGFDRQSQFRAGFFLLIFRFLSFF